ncbi:TetR/AcrR family transcriptional regulator [Paenibacillus sp. UNC451MF]|uniref:TetR/AcrR family transcriptional regulator n=1 Tax=Paenibacillus sp. UNC451MF TaxID=1449063 RepID=UPI00048ED5A4|nr:TetR/AcrR family transcriptional regulator [Paenibacillus sp. UNC451MF]
MSPRNGLDLHTVLQAAAEMADSQGLDEITLASLAQKLDIKSPSLYNHVNGLPGLRKKLAVYGLDQLLDVMTRAAVGQSGAAAVHAISEAYISFARTHPGLYDATLRAPDAADTEIQKVGGDIVDLAVRVLHAYDLKGDAAIHVVRGLRSLLHGFASLEQRGGFGLLLDLDVSFRLLIDTFLAGIEAMKQNSETIAKPEL